MRLLSLLLGLSVATQTLAQSTQCVGIWSVQGKQPHVGDAFTADAIASPDKKFNLAVTEESVAFTIGAQSVPLAVPVNTALMELVWAPDSKRFAINVSEGDHTGRWQTFLFSLDDNAKPRAIALDKLIQSIAATSSCVKQPNLGLVAWLNDGQEALIAIESTATDSCPVRGVQWVAKIDLSGSVLESTPAAELRPKWGRELGCRVKG
jgi:hypothetical protein